MQLGSGLLAAGALRLTVLLSAVLPYKKVMQLSRTVQPLNLLTAY
jgi:hypothetical protein